ncbi:cysteine desulfurase NifS [Desulfosporosinus nitroreducens]|uniref:Cysteine desulfurase IscS n=1 Tax=Desulfosporosinus nitroreducens TaxID=2018668 RepID=A0ABT8QND4_9FIRM|nr:cysteine desulfurase NifS [Desulfosporosinus nitroreducens]MCO1600118.1 cysteine desulfurase NifS [Desulfosporosinus nitroreducens]MDO0822852.1 cysteine desulfurase NifS [Desulfosporosinus nitroreducens]
MRRVYLDHSATTPVDPEVAAIMMTYYTEKYGNPSSVHGFGRETKQALEQARNQVAELIGAASREITFTSGGTEADNLAILGTAEALRKKGKHIITSCIEHHAVLETCEYLEKNGFDLTVIPVDEEGIISVDEVRKAIRPDTILITVMHANNEVGSIQPIAEIGKLAKEHGIVFHVDAVQSLGKIPINVEEMNVDLLTVSGHKIYGPKGVGALYVRKGVRIVPLIHGGGQERKRRSGTENMPGIIGFGKACELAGQRMADDAKKQIKLRDKLMNGIVERIEYVKVNGPVGEKRLPNNVNVSIRYVEGESLLLSLDMLGIAASSGSACTSGSLDPSHVLLGMGLIHEIAHGSLRFSLGRQNTEEEIDYVLEQLPKIVERLRMMSPLYDQVIHSKQS